MANQTPGNENDSQESGDNEFHSPEEAANVPERRGRNRRSGLRSNTVIQGRPQDVGAIIERSRSRNRSRNRNAPESSSDDDDDMSTGNSSHNEHHEVKRDLPPPPSSSASSVHPERQQQVDQANANAINNVANAIANAINNNANQIADNANRNANVNQNANAGPTRPPLRQSQPPVNINNPPVNAVNPSVNVPTIPVQPRAAPARQYQVNPQHVMVNANNNQRYQPMINVSAVNPQNQIQQLQMQLQQLATRVQNITTPSPAPAPTNTATFPGLDANETNRLLQSDDASDFYERKQIQTNVAMMEDKAARKRISKEYSDKRLENVKDAVDWFDRFDYVCDQWGIPYHIRYTECITSLFPNSLINEFRGAQQTEAIPDYPALKKWIFKQRNSRKRIAKADKAIQQWMGNPDHTTFQQYTEFASICDKYAREIKFGLDWGMNKHEINRIPEEILFDIFIDNAGAKEKLWQIFKEKVNGRRSMVKAKLLAKHMTFLEQGRSTKSQTHRKSKRSSRKSRSKRKQESVHAMQQSGYNEPQTYQESYPPRGRGNRGRGYRGRGRGRTHTTRWRRNRFKKQRGPHNAGVNCHLYGHTPEDCWTLHPELRPSGKKRGQVFAIQRRINEAKADLQRAINRYEESTESDHNTEEESNRERKENEEYSTSSEEEANEETESSSPNFKYRPRQ
ncbi:MAG: hypothetical protein SYR96_36320 [Actinomycetota bacterium]|nr:hypothetical protein [Actinomycetota bacterium]